MYKTILKTCATHIVTEIIATEIAQPAYQTTSEQKLREQINCEKSLLVLLCPLGNSKKIGEI